jgi:hypothetical protein
MPSRIRSIVHVALALGLLTTMAAPALAGPPLICHRFEIGTAASLPFGDGADWNTPLSSYDVKQLTADTLRLLTPSAPILVRMETMRRATIYAGRDAAVAHDLLARLMGRALTAEANGRPDALAWFDAGYLVESYRQAGFVHRDRGSRSALTLGDELTGVDGYAWVRKALQLAGTQPEMEFAASLMKEGDASAAHRRRALAGVKAGSLLAQNVR